MERLFSNFCVLVHQLKSIGQIQPAHVFVNKIFWNLSMPIAYILSMATFKPWCQTIWLTKPKTVTVCLFCRENLLTSSLKEKQEQKALLYWKNALNWASCYRFLILSALGWGRGFQVQGHPGKLSETSPPSQNKKE